VALITGTKKGDYIDTNLVTAGVLGGPATDGADQISGLGGDDEIHAGAGDDQVDGGAGDDFLDGGTGNDSLVGDAGSDRLYGGDGVDRLNGGKGNDVETGGAGDDVFVISSGHDVVTDFAPPQYLLIDFEGIAPQGGSAEIPVDYLGLQWADNVVGPSVNARAYDNDAFNAFSPGMGAVLTSGEAVGVTNADPGSSFISFSSTGQDFDLVSGYFAAVLMPDSGRLDLTIEGLDDGVVVGTLTIQDLSQTKNFITFGDDFKSIDTVNISTSVVVAPSQMFYNTNVAMDDLLLRVSHGDRLEVSSVSEMQSLIASATSDGAGNTILGQGGSTTTLLGVDPSEVNAEWFVIG
jgi:hypothetical protein